jgi:hypothetical protein
MRVSCKDILERAGAIHDREVHGRERLGIWLHLVLCKVCRRFLRQYALASQTAAAVAHARCPADKARVIANRITQPSRSLSPES